MSPRDIVRIKACCDQGALIDGVGGLIAQIMLTRAGESDPFKGIDVSAPGVPFSLFSVTAHRNSYECILSHAYRNSSLIGRLGLRRVQADEETESISFASLSPWGIDFDDGSSVYGASEAELRTNNIRYSVLSHILAVIQASLPKV